LCGGLSVSRFGVFPFPPPQTPVFSLGGWQCLYLFCCGGVAFADVVSWRGLWGEHLICASSRWSTPEVDVCGRLRARQNAGLPPDREEPGSPYNHRYNQPQTTTDTEHLCANFLLALSTNSADHPAVVSFSPSVTANIHDGRLQVIYRINYISLIFFCITTCTNLYIIII